MTADLSRDLAAVLALMERATPGEWEWWTSNSTRRLSVRHGRDGGVLHAYLASDGLADISVSDENAALIAAAVNFLRAHSDSLRRDAANARRYFRLREIHNHMKHYRDGELVAEGPIPDDKFDAAIDAMIRDADEQARAAIDGAGVGE